MNPPIRSATSGLAVPSMVSGLNLAGVAMAVCRASAIRYPAASMPIPEPKKMPTACGPWLSMMVRNRAARSSRQASQPTSRSVPSTRSWGRSRRSGW